MTRVRNRFARLRRRLRQGPAAAQQRGGVPRCERRGRAFDNRVRQAVEDSREILRGLE